MHRGPFSPPAIEVRDTGARRGLGVYATRAFCAGEVVECCPVVIFDLPGGVELPHEISVRMFNWQWLIDHHNGRQALALGYGSLYNHRTPPNLRYTANAVTESLEFTAVRDISRGEELTIDYDQDAPLEMPTKERWAARHNEQLA